MKSIEDDDTLAAESPDTPKKRRGKQPTLHMVDGKQMTVKEIADMLGMAKNTLFNRRGQMGGVSYQLIVDMYRDGRLLTKHDKWPRHCVHGRWITLKQAAEELNCKSHSLNNWRSANRDKNGNKPTLEEAYDHFKNAPKRGRGKVPSKHWVNGKQMTVRQAAEKYGTEENTLRNLMSRHQCSLGTAVNRLEQRRKRKAEQAILEILGGGK